MDIFEKIFSFIISLLMLIPNTSGIIPGTFLLDNGTETVTFINKSSFGSTAHDSVMGAAGRSGVFYVCGEAESTEGDFGAEKNTGCPYGYLRKYNASGDLEWTVIISTDETKTKIQVEDVAVLRSGNAIVCGYKAKNFNEDTTLSVTAPYVAEFDTSGNLLWDMTFSYAEINMFNCITATSNGFAVGGRTSYISSEYSGIQKFGSTCAVFMRYKINVDSESGEHTTELMWKKGLSGTEEASVLDISADLSNNIFLSVSTSSDDGNFSAYDGLEYGSISNVILKYNGSGNFCWYYTISTTRADNFGCVEADGNGGCIAGGYTSEIGTGMEFGGTLKKNYSRGGVDSFVFKLDSDGACKWSRRISGSGDDFITGIVKAGSYFMVCGYSGSYDGEFTSNCGYTDGFVDIISSSGSSVQVLNYGGSENDRVTAIAYSNSNMLVCGENLSDDYWFEGMNSHLQYADESKSTVITSGNLCDCFTAYYSVN